MSKTKPVQSFKMARQEGESEAQTTARACLTPELRAALTLVNLGSGISGADLDVNATHADLLRQAKLAARGDLTSQESMLAIQANLLDSLFHALARRALVNMGQYVAAADTYMRLALKAQSQCRTTIDSLAQLKRPSLVSFVKQTNISAGPQQVNNGTGTSPEIPFQPNELLGPPHEMESVATQAASGLDPDLETVGKIHGAEDGRRKAGLGSERLSRGR